MRARLAEQHNMGLTADEKAVARLAELGYDPEMGARPLRRVIQQKVEDPISEALLAGEFKEGDTVLVTVDEEGEIVLRPSEKEPEADFPELPEPAV